MIGTTGARKPSASAALLVAAILGATTVACPAASAEAPAVAAMKAIQTAWKSAATSGRPLLSKCANGAWSLNRLAADTIISMDVRQTSSIVDPLQGIITIYGNLETNARSPNADGFMSELIGQPGMACFKTKSTAQAHVLAEDWKPVNGSAAPFEMRLYYKFTGTGAVLVDGDTFFINALSEELLSADNQPRWSDAIATTR